MQVSQETNEERPVDRVGVQCFVFQSGKLLLGNRKNIFGHGSWGLPGGILEKGETILEAAARELYEETGLIARIMRVVTICDGIPESNYHLQIGVLVDEWSGAPEIREPHVCSDLAFFGIEELPEPIFVACISLIQKYRLGHFY